MEYTELGETGCAISRIGFGCAALGGYDYGHVDDRESIAAIHRALDLGINFFDTADVYGLGHAETVLSQALGDRRHDVLIATKFGVAFDQTGKTWRDVSPKYIRQALEASLRRLRLDVIPLFQMHWLDGKTPLPDTMAQLVRCQEEGKIRFIGCCNLTVVEVAVLQQVGRIESIQLPLNLLNREAAPTLAACFEQYGMSGLTYSSLAHGALSGRQTEPESLDETDLRRRNVDFREKVQPYAMSLADHLARVSRSLARTPTQLAIRWVLQQAGVHCALVGAKQRWQVEENAGATDWLLNDWELQAIDRPFEVADRFEKEV